MTEEFKRSMADLKRNLKRVAEKATAGGHNISVAGRSNVVKAINIGQPGSVQGATAHQKFTIRQDGSETTEESETTSN
jgi:hypothetical protein